MVRKWIWLVGVFGLFALRGPVAAQEMTPWAAWLYNASGQITQVSSSGQVLYDLMLPLLPGQTAPRQVAVSRSGQLAAYVSANPTLNAHQLVFFDLINNRTISDFITTDLTATGLDVLTDDLLFNETETRFAYGQALSGGGWRISALDIGTGSLSAELRPDNPAAAAAGLPAGGTLIPVVRRFEGEWIAFTMLPVGAPALTPDFGSYLWNIQTGEVVQNTVYPGLSSDVLSLTGDIVLPMADGTQPNNDAAFSALGGQRNTLQVVDAATGRRFPFFADPNRSQTGTTFIQNGERVLANSVDPSGIGLWRVIDRDGRVTGEFSAGIAQVFGLRDGFIYLTDSDPALLVIAYSRDGIDPGTPVGQSAPGAVMQLAWAGDAVPPAVGTFGAWLDLADTVSIAGATQLAMDAEAAAIIAMTANAPSPTPIPSATPTEPPFSVAPTPVFLPTPESFVSRLRVGENAVVTRPGNGMPLRRDPNSQSPALILLYSNMVVTVLEGPELTDGYIWWRVQVTGDRSDIGWAIEGANGEANLYPLSPEN